LADGTEPDQKAPKPDDADMKAQRQSIADGVFGSVKHLQEAHATGLSSIRKTDRVSQVILVLAIVAVAVAQAMPSEQFIVMVIADILLALSLCAFLALRFGVLRTLGVRQAILVWQLILGSFMLGLFLAFNLKMIVLLQAGLSVGK
jgi:hypothetical protein